MRRIEIAWQDDGADSGWVCRIDGSTYEGGGHVAGTEELGPDDLDAAVAAWLRQRGGKLIGRDDMIASALRLGLRHEDIAVIVGLTSRQIGRIGAAAGLTRERGRPRKEAPPHDD